MITAFQGPLISYGQTAPILPGLVGDYNAELGYNGFCVGFGLVDPRFGYRNGAAAGTAKAVVIPSGGDYFVLYQAPNTHGTTTVSAAAETVSGTPVTIAGSAGVVQTTSSTFILQTGLSVPSGAWALDGVPAMIAFGQNLAIQVPDPRTMLARALSVTAQASAAGGAFLVVGYDMYGQPQTETITSVANSTVNGAKGWKFITSVTPQFTDASYTYSVGTSDIYEFPLATDSFVEAKIFYNNAAITASTGFTAADRTSPATSTTGSVRGTYALQTASNDSDILAFYLNPFPWEANTTTGLFGVVPA